VITPEQVAEARKRLGRQLSELRRAAGYSQETFASARGPAAGYTRSQIANVETGRGSLPRSFWERFDRDLGANGTLLATYEQVDDLVRRHREQSAQLREQQRYATIGGRQGSAASGDSVATTSFERESVGGPPDHPSRPAVEMVAYLAAQESWRHAAGSGGAVEDASIEHARIQVRRLASHYHQLPPIRALAEAREVRNLAYMLLERTRRPGQMADLYLTAGQACGLLAMASFDLAQWDAAADQIGAARAYADLVGHPSLRCWAAGTQALIAYWTGQPRHALTVLQAVDTTTADGASTARLHAIRARAWSYLGNAEEVTGALLTADRAMDATHGVDDLHDGIGGELGWGRSLHHACAGTALLAIGHAEAAARRIREALEAAPDDPYSGLVPPRARIDLATAELAAGRLDAAVDALGQVWDTPARYRRHGVTSRLEQLGRTLQAPDWRDHRPAAELRDRIEVFVGEAVAARALPAA
jgi:tetratricopeptide (TPR) repeat protein